MDSGGADSQDELDLKQTGCLAVCSLHKNISKCLDGGGKKQSGVTHGGIVTNLGAISAFCDIKKRSFL